jgi:phospholipid-binding lipoprotein MlaA
VGSGVYLVLPFFGPSTIRDGIGDVVDSTWDPFSLYLEGRDYWVTKTVDVVNSVSLDKDTYDAIKQNSLDPYLFVRDAYVQNRQSKISQ